MKKQLILSAAGVLASLLLTACGQDPAIADFEIKMNDFCTRISELDNSINGIDASSDSATTLLLGYLDDLEEEFTDFGEMDFPKDYDYLESLADESASYMAEAVKSYHTLFSADYNEELAKYAKENYARAYKRLQIIIAFLHGEEPENVNFTTE